MRSPLVHWNINAQSTFGLGGKRQVEGQRRCCGTWRTGQSMGNEPDMSEPLKSEASRWARSAPKNKATIFSHGLRTERPCCPREEGWVGCTLLGWGGGGGRDRAEALWSSAYVLVGSVNRQERGPLLLAALLSGFSFPERTQLMSS